MCFIASLLTWTIKAKIWQIVHLLYRWNVSCSALPCIAGRNIAYSQGSSDIQRRTAGKPSQDVLAG